MSVSRQIDVTDLGNGEQVLGNVNNTTHLLDILDAGLDSLGVVGAGAVEDVLDLLILSLGPGLVSGTSVLDETTPDGDQAESDDRLLVHDIVLIADGVGAETGGAAEDGCLAEQAAAREGIDEALGLLLGVLGGYVARVADGGGGQRRESLPGDRGSEEGSCAWRQGETSRRSAITEPIGPRRADNESIVRTSGATCQS